MITREVKLPVEGDLDWVEGAVERTCRSLGLQLKVKKSLRSYPGSKHWHFNREGERGTLEVTFWEQERRLWLSVHSNRTGAWTEAFIIDLKSTFESYLKQKPSL